MASAVVQLLAVFACLEIFGSYAVNIDDGLGLLDPDTEKDGNSKGTVLEIKVKPAVLVTHIWSSQVHPSTKTKDRSGVHNNSYVILIPNITTDEEVETNMIPSDKNKTQVLRKLIPGYDFAVVPVVTGRTPVVTEKSHVVIATRSATRQSWGPCWGQVAVRGWPSYMYRSAYPCRIQPPPFFSSPGRPRQPERWMWQTLEVSGGHTERVGLSDKLGTLPREEGEGIDGKLGIFVEDGSLE